MMRVGDRSQVGVKRVVRGGSWNNNGRNCRSAIRNRNEPDNRNNNLGFRLSLARHAVGMGVIDQIVIQSRGCAASEKQGRRHVSSGRGCPAKACRWADRDQPQSQT